jgi:predicted lipid-binding transport protein (Tim44 family)
MAWAVLEVMDLFTSRGLLPDWTFMGALLALALGLPVVLATAFVQTPSTDKEAPSQGNRIDDTQTIPAPDPTTTQAEVAARPRLKSLFTWRRAWLGGMVACAALGMAVAVFGVMRGTGIGTPGTLLAQGLIEEGGLVILADFESTAGASAPSDLVTEALRIDLDQSPTFDLMDPRAGRSAASAKGSCSPPAFSRWKTVP